MRRREYDGAGCRAARRRLSALGVGLPPRSDTHQSPRSGEGIFRSQRFAGRREKQNRSRQPNTFLRVVKRTEAMECWSYGVMDSPMFHTPTLQYSIFCEPKLRRAIFNDQLILTSQNRSDRVLLPTGYRRNPPALPLWLWDSVFLDPESSLRFREWKGRAGWRNWI